MKRSFTIDFIYLNVFTVVFILLKLTKIISWSWTVVFFPTFIYLALLLLMLTIVLTIIFFRKVKK